MQKNHDWAKYYRYISDCAHRNGLMSSRALAEKADLSESLVSKFKVGETNLHRLILYMHYAHQPERQLMQCADCRRT